MRPLNLAVWGLIALAVLGVARSFFALVIAAFGLAFLLGGVYVVLRSPSLLGFVMGTGLVASGILLLVIAATGVA